MCTRARGAAVLLTALTVATLAGCISHVHYPPEARPVPVSSRPSTGMFDYVPTPGAVTLKPPDGHRHGYATHGLTLPASFEIGQPGNLMTGTYYDSGTEGRKPLVIVLPVWGVSEYPSTVMTHAILKRSRGRMNVLRIDGRRRMMAWKRMERATDLEEFAAGVSGSAKRLKYSVIDTRRLIDWAGTRAEIDSARIGLVGFSISAIAGTLAAQTDQRIRSAALVMGGARIGRIVSECPGNEKDTRDAVMAKLELELPEYERIITAAFEGLDPEDYPGRIDPRRVLIVDAAEDDCIPQAARDAWWDALGRPERISMNYSHRGSFMAMTPLGFNFLREKIYEHLSATL